MPGGMRLSFHAQEKNRQSRKYMPRNGFVLFLHLLIVFDIIKMLM
jgi:hypothetical protein